MATKRGVGTLADKVLIVTGASSGIGAATALAAAEAGMDVLINARRMERLARVAELVEERGRRAEIVVGDVAEQGLSQRLLDAADERFGRFDAVFANAGYGMELPATEVPEEALRAIFETNFFASVELIRLSALRLIASGRPGHLLMCSSCLAKFTLPGFSAYSATKAAQAHLCRAMRFELAPHGIEVSSVHPITTVTEFFDRAAERSGRESTPSGVHDHVPRWMIQTPERVAAAVIQCLRRPRSEVWTSHIVRLSSGLFNAFPSVLDMVMRREAKRLREG
ncbi:MAG TPA: SDR family NAD(P)-dependent oxidoreductase [Phycisphaerales bacterium]|nr:SDR family NAD(P)-dependent oxidoreductase [Phycisphaerales bacterium]HMP36202.1 SDR family NAD(P)-dependent oxidoreductase [Phycisphaerales bacterium]